MATKSTKNSKERKQSQPVSRSYSNTKGDKISVLKNGTKIVNGVETGKVATPEGTRMVMKNSGSSGLVKIGSKADAKYDDKGFYKKATYSSPFNNTIQTTTGIRNKDTATQNKYNDVVANKMGATTPAAPLPTIGGTGTPAAPTNGQQQGQPTPTLDGAGVTVTSYKDNGDGTTTNSLSDGSTSTVRYIKNADGSQTAVEVGSGQGSSPVLDAEKEYTASVRQQIQDLQGQKQFFDIKMEQLLKNNKAEYKDAISSIKSTFDSRAAQLGQSYGRLAAVREKAGYQTDAFRYTPTHAEGLVTNDENNYIMQLADLDAQEQALMLTAASAKNTKDWDALELQMKTYDELSTKKSTLLGSLLTTATEQNRRIQEEEKIEREIAEAVRKTEQENLDAKQGDKAQKRAEGVAPVIAKAIAKMTQEEAVAYVIKKAGELGIDPDILRSVVIDRGREDAAYAKSLIPKVEKAPKPTEQELKNGAFGTINQILSGDYSVNGVPYKDPSGFFTVQGFKTLTKAALASGVDRTAFLENYGGDLNPDQIESYGLTVKEKENLGY